MKKTPSLRKKLVPTTKGKIEYAVVRLNGKDIYLGRWKTKASQQEYDRVIGEWLAGGKSGDGRAEDISVTEVCVDYVSEMKKRYRDASGRPTEEFKTVQRIMKMLRANYGSTKAVDFKALRFKAMRQKFVDKGLSRYVANKYSRHIIRAFKLASENEKLPADNYLSMKSVEPLQKGRTEARETDPIQPVAIETINATIEHLHGIAADMIRLQLLTGMRPGELCQLKPEHIDREKDIW